MQVLLLLHEVPFELTCLLLFVFPNFLPKLNQLLAFCFSGWFYSYLGMVSPSGWAQVHSRSSRAFGEWAEIWAEELWREAAVPDSPALRCSVAINNWDLPPSVLQILQPGPELPGWGKGLRYLSFVRVFPLKKDVLNVLKLSLCTCGTRLESLWDLSLFFCIFSVSLQYRAVFPNCCLHLNQLE